MSTIAYAAQDSVTLLRRNLKHLRRFPSLTVTIIGMPVVFLLLFVYVFGGTMGAGLPGGAITVRARPDESGGVLIEFQAMARIDTPEELVAFRHGGILPYVMRQLVGKRSS